MLAEIAVDALGHFDRATLEGMQMHSRYLRDLIGRHAGTLPLRCIHHVEASVPNFYGYPTVQNRGIKLYTQETKLYSRGLSSRPV